MRVEGGRTPTAELPGPSGPARQSLPDDQARRRRPLARLAGAAARIPRYLNLAQRLLRDPSVSTPRKTALGLGVLYVALPVDLIPGIIPILGQLDDLGALFLGLRTALRGCSPESARAHLASAGLSETALDADIRTVQVVGVWCIASVVGKGAGLVGKPIGALRAGVTRAMPNSKSALGG